MSSKARNTVTINSTEEALKTVLIEAIHNAQYRWRDHKLVYLQADKPDSSLKRIVEGNHAALIRAQNMFRTLTGHHFMHVYKD